MYSHLVRIYFIAVGKVYQKCKYYTLQNILKEKKNL